MRDLNKIMIIGRLGADPIHRMTKKAVSVVNFPVATSRKIKGEEDTQWHKVVAWGKLGESCAEYLNKGDTAYVCGYIQSRTYTDQDGNERTTFEIIADEVNFLTPKRSILDADKTTLGDQQTA